MRVALVLLFLFASVMALYPVSAADCRETGCPSMYKCMADGECIHSSASTQEYCNTAYREHNLSYDSVDAASCDSLGRICGKIEQKCDSLPIGSGLAQRSMEECVRIERMCLQCQGDCSLKNNVNGVKNIVYGIAAGIAVLVIAVSGIQMASAEDAFARNNSKKAIVYSILALVIIVIGVEAVGFLWSSFSLAETYVPYQRNNSGGFIQMKNNTEACSNSIECLSGYCNNNICCDPGQCGFNQVCHNPGTVRPVDSSVCDAGRWKKPNNASCIEDVNCISGYCKDLVCCDVDQCGWNNICYDDGSQRPVDNYNCTGGVWAAPI